MDNVRDWMCLSLFPGLGLTGFWKLLGHYKSPAEVLRCSPEQLHREVGLRDSQLAAFSDQKIWRQHVEKQLTQLAALGGRAVCHADPAYSSLLRCIPDPPPVLYCFGDLTLLAGSSVAVVGSRASTNYGRRVARSLSRQLSEREVTVVSGLALGIDSEAHRGALEGMGSTVAVLGCGLDVLYPRQNAALYQRIKKDGLVVTEYPLGTRPEPFRFPARNRIIAGLSEAVVVVEAARKSGSLITAQLGLDSGREVFAVPGQVDSCKSEGAHWLIQQGAHLLLGVDDIFQTLEFAAATRRELSSPLRPEKKVELQEPDRAALLEVLENYPRPVDEVIATLGLSVSRANELFLLLEIEGCIEMLPGNMVRKV